jgi:hypothetical protein
MERKEAQIMMLILMKCTPAMKQGYVYEVYKQ